MAEPDPGPPGRAQRLPAVDMIDVVVVTYNSAEWIASCLWKLRESCIHRVIVVDNGSEDGTLRLVEKESVFQVRMPGNAGYAVAANRGIEHAAAPYVALVNPDCEVPRAFWDDSLRILESEPDACVVPRRLVNTRGAVRGMQPGYTAVQLFADMIVNNYFQVGLAKLFRALPGYHDPTWHWPHGACVIMRRQVLERLRGGLDEDFPMYMSDVVLGRSLHASGVAIRESDVDVVHREGHGSSITSLRRLALLNAGRIDYAKRFHGRRLAAMLRVLAWPGYRLRQLLRPGR